MTGGRALVSISRDIIAPLSSPPKLVSASDYLVGKDEAVHRRRHTSTHATRTRNQHPIPSVTMAGGHGHGGFRESWRHGCAASLVMLTSVAWPSAFVSSRAGQGKLHPSLHAACLESLGARRSSLRRPNSDPGASRGSAGVFLVLVIPRLSATVF